MREPVVDNVQQHFDKRITCVAKEAAHDLNKWISWTTDYTSRLITIYQVYERFGTQLRAKLEEVFKTLSDEKYIFNGLFEDWSLDKVYFTYPRYEENTDDSLDFTQYIVPYTFRFNEGKHGLELKTEIILQRTSKEIPHKFGISER